MQKRALAWLLFAGGMGAAAQTPPRSARPIEAAVLPLPQPLRAGATIVRQTEDGATTVLRKGTNDMVCVDATKSDRFLAYCYPRAMFAVYQRAAQLAKQLGSTDMAMDVADAIEREVKAGKLNLPRATTVGFAMMGPIRGYNAATNTANADIKPWQTIQIPFATVASLGLPEKPEKGMPWVMHSGMWMAHIMIEH